MYELTDLLLQVSDQLLPGKYKISTLQESRCINSMDFKVVCIQNLSKNCTQHKDEEEQVGQTPALPTLALISP